MSYELQPFEPPESKLFYRLGGETAIRHGQIGYLRVDFGKNGQGFWTTWFDNQRHLKNYGFKENLNDAVDNLRGEIFKDRAAMRFFCDGTAGVSLGERGTGFKLQNAGYTYCLRCKPGRSDYDACLFAYDNSYLLPEPAGLHELPEQFYTFRPSDGTMMLIVRGVRGPLPCDSLVGTEDELHRFADMINGSNHVTKAQEAAMLAGALSGWKTPAAKPWNYDMDGKPRILPQRKKDEPER